MKTLVKVAAIPLTALLAAGCNVSVDNNAAADLENVGADLEAGVENVASDVGNVAEDVGNTVEQGVDSVGNGVDVDVDLKGNASATTNKQ